MPVTRKETAALLTLIWAQSDAAYMVGYKHGEEGVENPHSPYRDLGAYKLPAKDLAKLTKELNNALDKVRAAK